MMQSKSRTLNWLLAVLVTVALSEAVGSSVLPDDEGLRIDIARDAQVKITNQLGTVSIETWKQNYVVVSANFPDGPKLSGSSPILIDNRNQAVSITVVRRPKDPPGAIDLSVRIPDSVHVEVTTGSGSITVRGIPVATVLKSSSGDVQAFVASEDLDLTAKSVTGPVASKLPSFAGTDGHSLNIRIGTGGRTLRINTESGSINVSEMDRLVSEANESNPPKLADASSTKASGTPASGSESEEISEGDVVRVDSQLVTLNMSVIDRSTNRGLLGLTQSDFKMFEDGVEQRIVQFDASSAPFDLILVIDLSGSTKDVLKLIRDAALRFVDAARVSDRIGVVTFAGKPTLVSSLTLDRSLLRERIGAMQTSGGDTKLYDAIDFTISEIAKERTKSRRTAIVLMSDGLDGSIPGVQGEGSRLTYKELLGRVQEFDGVLYTLWLNTEYEAMNPLDTQPEAFDAGYDRMKELADNGGGIFYEVERLENLAGAYEKVVADLGTVYSLSYRPLNKSRDGKWRAIRINVERPNAVARGKRGYYAN